MHYCNATTHPEYNWICNKTFSVSIKTSTVMPFAIPMSDDTRIIVKCARIVEYYVSSERRQVVCYGVERDWSDFRFLSGRWVARQSFYTNFTPAFYRRTTATYCSDVTKIMMVPRPARFLFPVALLPVSAWWQTPCFYFYYMR